jgi:hypothetical protein
MGNDPFGRAWVPVSRRLGFDGPSHQLDISSQRNMKSWDDRTEVISGDYHLLQPTGLK